MAGASKGVEICQNLTGPHELVAGITDKLEI